MIDPGKRRAPRAGGRAPAAALVLLLAGPAGPLAARGLPSTPQVRPSAQPSGTTRAQTLYAEGERALAERRYADAQRAYEALRELQPGTAEVHARLGLIAFQQGRFTDAIAPLRRAVALKPALPNIGTLLAMSLSEVGRHEEAVPGLEQGFQAATADRALRRMAGLHLQRSLTELGKDARAAAIALELGRLFPDDPEVLYHTGRTFGNYAYLQTMRLARVAPDSVWLHLAAGEANESQGLLDEALHEYRQVLAKAPSRPGLHARIGRVLLARAAKANGDPAAEAEALAAFEQELRIDPTSATAAYEIGEIQRKNGQLDAAAASFRRALDAYPSFQEALVGLGRTLVAAGQAEAALPWLQKASVLDPQDEVAFYQLARAHRALGREAEEQKALAAFERLRAARDQARVPGDRDAVTRQGIEPPGGRQ